MKYVLMILTFLWILAAAIVMLGISGCTRTQVRYVKIPTPAVDGDSCIDGLALQLHPWSFTPGSTTDVKTSCPEKFEICVEGLDAAALKMNLQELVQFARDVITLCGPKKPAAEAPK